MVKPILLFILSLFTLSADSPLPSPELKRDCLLCHQEQKIPSEFIYRRYLMKYSSKETIKKRLFTYLQSPAQKNSIMPPQFFGKYMVKEPVLLKDEILKERIDAFIQFYDISRKIYVPNKE